MVRQTTPKKLQREKKFEEALRGFWNRYLESLEERDRFLSALYMDEILQTILLSSPGDNSETALRDRFAALRKGVPEGLIADYEEDVEIALSKRFPEKYGIAREERAKELS